MPTTWWEWSLLALAVMVCVFALAVQIDVATWLYRTRTRKMCVVARSTATPLNTCWAGADPAMCILTSHHSGRHFGFADGQPVEWPQIDWQAEGRAWVAAGRPST